jgi:hypothetical protein
MDEPRKCIECGGEVRTIYIISRRPLPLSLEYGNEAPGFLGMKTEGSVSAEACNKCGRVTLRIPPVQAEPTPSEETP